MVDSLFLSPAFILTECSFIIVASIAAYELLIGDFIWAQQEEARRSSMQSHRGRAGYDSFAESRQLQLHGHRSLSPAGRGRGKPRIMPASRKGSNEETASLLYPSRSRGGVGVSNNRDARISEERYYSSSSPGDPRFATPGRGSSGDSTRRLFYKVILLALLSRFILLPMETFCLSETKDSAIISFDPTIIQILLRISQTFPEIAFASALGLLVIFCAKIAFAAMPPLSPNFSEGSIHGDDAEIVEDGTTEREGLLGEGEIKGQENDEGKDATTRVRRSSKMARALCITAARFSRTVLASKKTFAAWNIILSISYTVFVTAVAIPHAPFLMCEIYLWALMTVIFSILLLSLIYVAALVRKSLHPGIVRRQSSDSLAFRLMTTCTLLAIVFMEKVVCFSNAIVNSDGSDYEERIRSSYRRNTIEYVFFESLPVLIILFMMHRKRKEVHNDVLIIHSIMNNLFGSTGRLTASENSQLDTTNMAGEGTGSSTARSGGLGSRRFQTYGGSRGDSFPPSSALGNKPRRNIPRATSSSGAGRNDAPPLESGNSKKVGLKSYVPVRSMVTGRD
mmetsp:Transcript_21949/g.53098  ORF Transcript_21949/g.53098 Transcript_21949/m.53098 type:complete len:566 (+) Transcript_21949:64-1761(+)